MKKTKSIFLLLLLPILLLSVLSVFSCVGVPKVTGYPSSYANELPESGVYSIMSWNLGYGGLSAMADFIVDGGRHFIALSKQQVRKNVARMIELLVPANFFIFQEASTGTVLNHYTDLLGKLREKLPSYHVLYSPKELTHLLQQDSVGQASFLSGDPPEFERVELRLQDFYALVRIRHHALVSRTMLPGGRILTIINVHMSAFDKNYKKRTEQFEILDQYAAQCIQRGESVVMGGDFNYILEPCQKTWTTGKKILDWVVDLNFSFELSGLTLAGTSKVPTVRSVEKAFVEGENFQGIIDGFFVSKDIEVMEYTALDFGFECSDHNPVLMKFRIKTDDE